MISIMPYGGWAIRIANIYYKISSSIRTDISIMPVHLNPISTTREFKIGYFIGGFRIHNVDNMESTCFITQKSKVSLYNRVICSIWCVVISHFIGVKITMSANSEGG